MSEREVKFTRGPWSFDEEASTVQASEGMVPVARVYMVDDYPCVDGDQIDAVEAETNANAQLIAAAPELFEALKRAKVLLKATAQYMRKNGAAADYTVRYDEANCDGHCLADDCMIAFDDAQAALTKATGGQQ